PGGGPGVRPAGAPALFARVLGRRDVRRHAALPARGPVGAAGSSARGRSEPDPPDDGARLQRGRLHELSRQRRAALHHAGGVRRPAPARAVVDGLRGEVGLPIHFDTHDTSGIAAASVLAAIDAGADAVYGALDAMSGLTSQPNLSAMASALAGSELDPGLDPEVLQSLSRYWEVVRRYYAPFEADMRAGTADVYRHERPGPK